MTANMSSVWVSVGKTSLGSLSDQLFEPISNARFHFPSEFNSNATENTTISLRVCFLSCLKRISFCFLVDNATACIVWSITCKRR